MEGRTTEGEEKVLHNKSDTQNKNQTSETHRPRWRSCRFFESSDSLIIIDFLTPPVGLAHPHRQAGSGWLYTRARA